MTDPMDKKVAIMQPYFLPYFGYFQLINEVDIFVLYNDVQFIKQGWINRNRLLINKSPQFFTVPLLKVSSNKQINETEINHAQLGLWLKKILKTVNQSYNKSKNLEIGLSLLNGIQQSVPNFSTIDQLNSYIITQVCSYLDIRTKIIDSSSLNDDKSLRAQDRVLSICKDLSANEYINPIGGKELYSKEDFLQENLKLNFLESKTISGAYSLSILHTIMVEDKEEIKSKLNSFHVS